MKRGWKPALCWALYDWANTVYALVVLAGFYPIFYAEYWARGLSPADQTFWYGLTVSAASITVGVLAPFLGSFAELSGKRKKGLRLCMIIGTTACFSLVLVAPGQFWVASLIYVVGTVCYFSGNLFYDSLLGVVAPPGKQHLVSGLGFSLGYSASTLVLLISLVLLGNHEAWGIESPATVIRGLFVLAAAWWAVFSLPLLLGVHDPAAADSTASMPRARDGFKRTWSTLKDILRRPLVRWFLIAYLFYIDGLNTVITMSINYAKVLGFGSGELLIALLVVQVVGVPSAITFGWLGQRIGPLRMIQAGLVLYLGVTAYGAVLDVNPRELFGFEISDMYILAGLIGLAQGGVQALSRSYFNSIIPADKTTAYFGFYSMIGKSAAIIGPLLMGVVALITDDPRYGIAAVSVLFLIGMIFLHLAARTARSARDNVTQ